MKTVIGLVGEALAGKETFVRLFRKVAEPTTIGHHKSGDVLADTFRAWGGTIPFSRENAQRLVWAIEQEFGRGRLARAVAKRIENDPSEIVFYDGVRWHYDVEVIKTFPRHLIVYVTADEQVRYERAKKRKLEAGGKIGENVITLWQFRNEARHETEMYIPGIGAKDASWKIVNNDDSEERYLEDIRNFYNLMGALIK
ncbi:MAG: hypothetical protein HYT12_03975 [Candidatus Liptonbacteria bacterium]|nr:hypothetical protein [Candidatus Liptonbacteria bacterium]